MARLFAAASSQYLENATMVLTAAPLTMSVWGKPGAGWGANNTAFSIGHPPNRFDIRVNADSTLQYVVQAGGANSTPSVAGIVQGTWQHYAIVEASTTSHSVYLNGGTPATGTSSVAPSSGGATRVGATGDGGDPWDGALCEAAAWNVALTTQELSALAAGVLPLRVRPSSLVFYAPVWGIDSPEPELTAGNLDLTLLAAPTFAAHAPVQAGLLPTPWYMYAPAAAAAPPALLRPVVMPTHQFPSSRR